MILKAKTKDGKHTIIGYIDHGDSILCYNSDGRRYGAYISEYRWGETINERSYSVSPKKRHLGPLHRLRNDAAVLDKAGIDVSSVMKSNGEPYFPTIASGLKTS